MKVLMAEIFSVQALFLTVFVCSLFTVPTKLTFVINCSNHFEDLFITDDGDDDDDDNDSKSGISENITEEFLTNDGVRNSNKTQKSCITNTKYQNKTLPKRNDTQTDHNRRESMKALSRRNKIIKDHH